MPPAVAAPPLSAGPSGETDRFRWRNLPGGAEVELEFDLPLGCRQTDIAVDFRQDSLRVQVVGRILAEGELLNRCDPEGSRWEIRAAKLVVILEKPPGRHSPWPAIFVDDCKEYFDHTELQRLL